MSRANPFLDDGISDESDAGSGYDSEAAEPTKSRSTRTAPARINKRRKLSPSPSADEDEEDEDSFATAIDHMSPIKSSRSPKSTKSNPATDIADDKQDIEVTYQITTASSNPKKEKKPGVIYLSALPPYLKPSALKHLLAQRGFEPVTRLFLTPASKHAHGSKKNSRQLYTEGWLEFASKKTAKRCAEALNAQQVGGKKGGFYYDDLWNMKYLRGMGWEELMEGVREERREGEGRRDEERRRVAAETKVFLESVDVAKRREGIKRKRKAKGQDFKDDTSGPMRDWRQFEVAGKQKKQELDSNSKQVLAQIF